MSDESKTQSSKWQILHERGLEMSDSDIDFITDNIVAGTKDALDYFEIDDPSWPRVIFSDNINTPGYVPDQEVINIPFPYLKSVEEIGIPISNHQQMVYMLPDGEPFKIPYSHWLRLAGREETVHHLQKVGNPRLRAKYSKQSLSPLTQLDRLLCDIEVEARRVVDAISIKNGEKPVWQDLDQYLATRHPGKYNNTIDDLLMKMGKY